jgi:hypothetical protein
MTCIMCNPWKKTFTLVPLAFFTMFSPSKIISYKGFSSYDNQQIITICKYGDRYLNTCMFHNWAFSRNQVKIIIILRPIFTLNPVGYHFLSHRDWKPSFLIFTKLRIKHHMNQPDFLCWKKLDIRVRYWIQT